MFKISPYYETLRIVAAFAVIVGLLFLGVPNA